MGYIDTVQTFPFRVLTKGYVNPLKHNSLFYKRKNYPECTMEYVQSGRGHLIINGESFEPGPDSLFILHKGSDHSFWTDPGETMWRKLCVIMDGSLPEYLFHIYGLEHVYFIPDAADLKKYMERIIRLNLDAPHISETGAVLFHEFIAAIAEKMRKTNEARHVPPVIQELKKRIMEHPEKRIELQDFAAETGYSVPYLIRRFGEAYEIAPIAFQNQLKYENAVRLLRNTELSIKEISDWLGFFDQFSFSRFFRKRNGKSPRQFRKALL